MTGQAERSAPEIDYPVHGRVRVASRAELIDALAAHRGQPVRLIGGGSAQLRLPPPAAEPTLLCLEAMRSIQRLDPGDLTCTVDCGVTREQLDQALEEVGLWLPVAGSGTIGGLCAADLYGPLAPGAASPRSLLLGLEGVLADGLPFKAGARVVKSVAGFDLQKLFVGSRGRLFAATALHLKLRPRPRCVWAFAREAPSRDAAVELFGALRATPGAVHELWLQQTARGCSVHGALAGHPGHLETVRHRLGLGESAGPGPRRLEPSPAADIVQGLVRPSRLGRWLSELPAATPVLVAGTGQFEAALPPDLADAVTGGGQADVLAAELRAGPPARRGRATPRDPGAARLAARLAAALDPLGMLQ